MPQDATSQPVADDRARDLISPVLERDLDMVLLLDGNSGGPLIPYLLQVAGLEPTGAVRTIRSTPRNGGMRQTDIEVTWDGGSLLIENKVESGFTRGQCESYREEVERRQAAGQEINAILVCPGRRRASLEHKAPGLFDHLVTTEDLVAALEGDADRLAIGSRLVLRAVSESPPGADPARSAWGDGYRAALTAIDPYGAIVAPGDGSLRTATAGVAEFASTVPDLEQVWKLGHHVSLGLVRMELDVTPEAIVGLPDGVVHISKKRMQFLEADVPPMTFDRSAEAQAEALRAAAEVVVELRQWAIDHLSVS